ncbi:MAG TPA: M14 family zinc carboxypeptidase [Thermoanaerobaculales bacterium]|nr:M14 family zinc carboxypeptidase [Thermoanaerobaculales bacterium]HPA79816.1 M14 family zinc carboxypeptidase [Thermoanaerobaculales bacterium]HQL29931.1 M14 family zinc carboxypeptidase [Thermoanaerobaculales bacterium]HQN95161.1 M14 family zinc carboxypeptidase [Thermoanaerobaculales bacterium]HQP42756.1 M14 family zinc carboxypeptidase [Thermoanaerobaculales bacterium]
MRRVMLTVVLLGVMTGAAAAVAADGPMVIRIVLEERSRLEELSLLVSIDDVRDGLVIASAFPAQLERLAKAGFEWETLPEPEAPKLATMCPAGWENDPDRTWECYPTYAQYVGFLNRYAADYPALCRLVDLGATTNQARPHRLWALRISDNPDLEEDEPEVLYSASIHGDETTGYGLMLHLIAELLDGYGGDPEITALVDDLEIWINPAANPDGTYYSSDATVDGAIREYTNASGGWGVDGNRNFPDPDDGPHPDGNPWWTETQHMMAFAEAHRIVLSANFHGGAEVVNYPWDTWSRRHVDDAWLIAISRAYADAVHAVAPAGYLTDLDNGITNGWDWYTITGGRQDYMTGFRGGREVTIEISSTKLLPASQLDDHWLWNRAALLGYLGQSRKGIRGLVTDPAGQPLDARIEIVGLDTAADNSYALTDPDVGDYHRMLLPGTYHVLITATGHEPAEFYGVTVPSGGSTILDAVLVPLPTAAVSGEVTDHTGAPIAGATVEVPDLGLSTTTGGNGAYALPAVFEGDYDFRVSSAGFETIAVTRTVVAPASLLNFALAPLEVAFETDLEVDDGGLASSQGWQWGSPSGAGNPGAHSGTKVWATNLSGDYQQNAHWYLDLAAVPIAGGGRISFWHWYEFESSWDGGNLSVRPAGSGSYTLLTPDGGYPSSDVSALGQPGFTGTTGEWQEVSFELGEWAGQTVDLRWHFASDSSYEYLGWYLDDITVTGAEHLADFEYSPADPAVGQPVAFTDRSSGPVAGWQWEFGDGGSSTEQNPSHAFPAEGVYPVTLTATFPEGPRSITQPVAIGGGAGLFGDGFESGDTGAWSATVP